uniref:Peptide-N(4)-(N-acetyl-beta-glucosaminyl)asparagine amidase n=1 Tax=Alona affinis TaxID=381656 RepID=A0A9N6WSI5_9CRUS|nr:EOG090X06HD [Alona affinis]
MSANQLQFSQTLTVNSRHVLVYENPALQAKAKACVPVNELLSRANKQAPDPTAIRDALLVELLNWFKNEFFKWFDAAQCQACNRPMESQEPGVPSTEDVLYGANRVENYECSQCRATDRFPRYNDPGKLLETRRGRCGEWANCFTLICRALKYDARYVLDWTDHVWTEVYSYRLKRWLHCDSCEAACDKPLLYDVGWGKKLTYVIAFSKDEVQDVTWRYTRNHKEVLKRRTLVPEEWLLAQNLKLSRQLQSTYSSAQKDALVLRLAGELAELMLPKKVKQGEDQGRISGDMNWRRERGELGDPTSSQRKPVAWIPTEDELFNGEFSLEYSSSLDQYIRRSDKGSITKGWSNGVFQYENVFRKQETDWNMTFLCRTEGSSTGAISWKFDLSATDFVILQASVSCPGTTFEDGEIRWKICGQDHCQILPNGCVDHEIDLSGSKWCVLSAELTRGRGNVAWQHAQIARQSTKGLNSDYPLVFRVLFGSL